MSDRIAALMKAMKSTGLSSLRSGAVTKAGLGQLTTRNHAMLLSRHLRDH
jgi:hypothetical protein